MVTLDAARQAKARKKSQADTPSSASEPPAPETFSFAEAVVAVYTSALSRIPRPMWSQTVVRKVVLLALTFCFAKEMSFSRKARGKGLVVKALKRWRQVSKELRAMLHQEHNMLLKKPEPVPTSEVDALRLPEISQVQTPENEEERQQTLRATAESFQLEQCDRLPHERVLGEKSNLQATESASLHARHRRDSPLRSHPGAT